MDIADIERLIDIIKQAKISELTVSIGGSTVRLRKPLVSEEPTAASHVAKPVEASVVEEAPVQEAAPAEVYITAPMVGIFHSLDGIGVKGSQVKAGQAVGAIESMKLMNDVICRCDGVIAEVLIDDGMPVEYGQNLFKMEPV